MADVEEDRISIVVEADTGNARNEIANVGNAVEGLKDRIGSLNSAFAALRRMADGNFKGLAESFERLANSNGGLSTFADNVRKMTDGLSELNGVDASDISDAGAKVGDLARGIGSLGGIDANRLDALARGLQYIPGAVRTMSDTSQDSITGLKSKLDQLATSAERASKVGNGIGNLGTGLRNIPKGLEAFGELRNYDGAIDTLSDVIGKLQFSLSSFDRESRANVSALKNLAEGLRSLSALGADADRLSAGLRATIPPLREFVAELNGAVSDDDLARFRELAQAVDQVASSYSRLSSAKSAVKGATAQDDGQAQGGAFQRLSSLASDKFQQVQPAFSGLGEAATAINPKLGAVVTTLGKVATIGGKVASVVGSVGSKAFSVASVAAQRYLGVIRQIVSAPIDAIRSKFEGLANTASRIVSMAGSAVFYNSLFAALRAATDGLATGIQNLYQWSLLTGNSFVGTMNSCATSVLYFKNSVGAAASELLDALAPALETIVNYAVAALNAINQLLAALTGHSTWRRAVRAQTQFAEAETDGASGADDTAKSLGKATKAAEKYKNTVLGFDELNKLNDVSDASTGSGSTRSPSSGAGGGASVPDYGSMFEDVPINDYFKDLANTDDWTKLGEDIANALNDWERSIDWDAIDETAAKWSKRVWTAFNGFVSKRDWTSFGYTIGRGINVGLHFIDDIAQNANFEGLGAGIAGALNEAVGTIDWPALGRVMTDGLKVALEFLHGFMNGSNGNTTYAAFNFDALRDKINEAIDAAFGNINWQQAVTDVTEFVGQLAITFASGISRIAHDIDDAVQNTDWVSWGSQVARLLNEAVQAIDWASLGRFLTDGLKVAFEGLQGFVTTFDWEGFRSDISTAIDAAFGNINWQQAAQTLASVLGEIGKTLLTFSGVILDNLAQAILSVDWADLGRQLGDWINDMLSDVDWNKVGQTIAGLFGAVFQFLWSAIEEVDWIGLAGDIFQLIGGMIEGIDWGTIGAAVGGLIVDLFSDAWDALTNTDWAQVMSDVCDVILSIFNGVFTAIGEFVGTIGEALWQFVCDTFGWLSDVDWSEVIEGLGQTLLDIITGAIAALGGFVGDLGSKLLETIKGVFTPTEAYGKESGGNTGQNYSGGLSDKLEDVKSAAQSVGQGVKDKISSFVTDAKNWGQTTSSNLKQGISDKLNDVKSAAQSVGNGIKDAVKNAVRTASTWGSNTARDLASGLKRGATGVKNSASSLAKSVKNEISGLAKSASTWGSDLASKFASGISSKAGWVSRAASNIANAARRILHFSTPDEGPLKDFDTYAPDMMELFARGIYDGRKVVTDSLEYVTSGISSALTLDYSDVDMPDPTASIANAVALGVVGSQPVGGGQSQQQDRPIELVLRIDGEDIARASYKGMRSLMDRGVIAADFV